MTDTYTITYTARTITYTLNGTDTTTGLLIRYLGDQGFGLAPLRRITTRGPLQDGDSDIDFRLEPRVLQIPLMVVNASATAPKYQHYEIREKLLSIFRPGDDAYITVTRSDGVTTKTRQINVRVLGGMSFDVDPDTYHVRTVVQLRADDPTWYDPQNIDTFYTNANLNGTQVFPNLGNWDIFPVIFLEGAITNPVITNVTTGQVISITAVIPFSTVYTINLLYGKKTVFDNASVNRISTVSAASNLATWSLVPGNNTIAITGTVGDINARALFSYYPRFTGI
jgi:phage-related protein